MIGRIVQLLEGASATERPWRNLMTHILHEPGSWQFVRFLAVGSLNFLFYYTTFAALHLLELSPTAAVVIATVVAVLFNFCTTGRIVFRDDRLRILPRFVAVYAVQCLLNVLFLRLLIAAGLPVLVAEALVIGVLAILTFVALKQLVFSKILGPDRSL
jgi:putative flippase GtrA